MEVVDEGVMGGKHLDHVKRYTAGWPLSMEVDGEIGLKVVIGGGDIVVQGSQ